MKGESLYKISKMMGNALTDWWLAKRGRANTPNWDLACRARVGDREGLILVEAKAHLGEFGDDRCGATNRDNFARIRGALADATAGWNALTQGFALSADSYYQLSNRFAFAWKLATMGVPVVLVYLGFLNAHEMAGGGRTLLANHKQWRDCVTAGAQRTVPDSVWDKTLHVGDVSLTVLIRSAEVRIEGAILSHLVGKHDEYQAWRQYVQGSPLLLQPPMFFYARFQRLPMHHLPVGDPFEHLPDLRSCDRRHSPTQPVQRETDLHQSRPQAGDVLFGHRPPCQMEVLPRPVVSRWRRICNLSSQSQPQRRLRSANSRARHHRL